MRNRARLRLRFRAVLSLITDLAGQIERDGFKPDYIVTVDRNSGIVGSIFAGYIGLRAVVSIAAVHRRLPDGSRETRLDTVQPDAAPSRRIEGARAHLLQRLRNVTEPRRQRSAGSREGRPRRTQNSRAIHDHLASHLPQLQSRRGRPRHPALNESDHLSPPLEWATAGSTCWRRNAASEPRPRPVTRVVPWCIDRHELAPHQPENGPNPEVPEVNLAVSVNLSGQRAKGSSLPQSESPHA